MYEPSSVVIGVINYLEEQRNSLLDLQEKHGVKVWHMMFLFSCVFKSIVALVICLICLLHYIQIPCEIDTQFAGMVEAWASGLTWREIMMDSAMDDGDLARLLRRTMDLLAQVCYRACRFHVSPMCC